MSLNLLAPWRPFLDWDSRKRRMVDLLARYAPDLMGIQEGKGERIAYLLDELHGRGLHYGYFGVGRSDGRDRGEHSGIFFNKDRFTFVDGGHFWLSETPEQPGTTFPGTSLPRMVTWAKLSDEHGRDVFHFNTHLAWDSDSARVKSASLLKEKIASIAGDNPVIVTGDFNSGTRSKPYRMLTEGLRDTYSGPRDTSYTMLIGASRVDWILTGGGLHSGVGEIAREVVSDHYPVYADICFP